MIKSFKDPEFEKIWNGYYFKKLPSQIQSIARRKLRMINNAQTINNMRIPPANRLEKLKGDLKGQYSKRIKYQWRIVFSWRSSNVYHLYIIDYH
jgi:proteic killer suppression protein